MEIYVVCVCMNIYNICMSVCFIFEEDSSCRTPSVFDIINRPLCSGWGFLINPLNPCVWSQLAYTHKEWHAVQIDPLSRNELKKWVAQHTKMTWSIIDLSCVEGGTKIKKGCKMLTVHYERVSFTLEVWMDNAFYCSNYCKIWVGMV